MAGGGVGLLALQLQQGFLRFHVFFLDLHFLIAAQLVGHDVFDCRQLGDFLDALRVKDVGGVQLGQRGLLQIVNGGVFQHVAGEVVADLLNDLVAEAVARLVQVHEVQRLAHGFERLGELGGKQVFQRLLVGSARAADALRHAQHVFAGLVHAHEEFHLDVGADVVLADQALVAGAVDVDGLERNVHQLRLVDDGIDHAPRERDFRRGPQRIDDHGRALLHLAVELGEHGECAQDEDGKRADGKKNEQGGFGHDGLWMRKRPGAAGGRKRKEIRRDRAAARQCGSAGGRGRIR